MDSLRKKELAFLISIFFFALFWRIFFCFFFKENILYIQTNIFGDTQDYIKIAQNFLSGKGLISSPDRIAYRPPLYPLSLSGIYYLFGNGYWPIRIVQAILDALTCIMVYFLGKNILNKRTGVIASLICTIYPFFIFFTGFELTETLFIFLLILTFLSLIKTSESFSRKYFVWDGILLGLSALCRPLIAGFAPFVLMGLALNLRPNKKEILTNLGIVVLFFLLTLSPWVIRNFLHFKKFVPLTTYSGQVIWEGNNPLSTGGPCGYWPKGIEKLSEIEQDRYLGGAAIEIIRDNPKRFIKLMGKKFIRFWNIVPNYEGFSSFKYRIISMLSDGIILPLSILGIILSLRIRRKMLLFYLIIIFFTFFHMIFLASIRYRVPIMPFMIIFSAYSIQQLMRYTKKYERSN